MILLEENANSRGSFTEKLFGGLKMSMAAVIIMAVGAAVVTAVFLIVPQFKDTSFMQMGVTVEAWVLFAVLIMSNCKKPLESAVKTFLFFLISQPLIYLLQVPFTQDGFGIFRYYRYWFIITLFTFPAAFIGWFITKKNWLSLLIFSPVLCLLSVTAWGYFKQTAAEFPKLVIAALFCVGQIVLYVLVFTSDIKQKAAGFVIPVAAAVIYSLMTPELGFITAVQLPDDPVLDKTASVTASDTAIADVMVTIPEEDYIRIEAKKYGSTELTVKCGGNEYHYRLIIEKVDKNTNDVRIESIV